MKLLIELDEEYVRAIDKIKFLVGGRTDRKLQLEIIKAIKNGKTLEQEPILDKIRAEIKQLRLHKTQFITSDNKVCIDSQEVLNIIDKYKAEQEET